MITTLLGDVSTKIELAKQLKEAQSEVKAIEATLAELDKLAIPTRQLASTVQTCRGRLSEELIAPVIAQTILAAQDVQSSRQRFAKGTNRRESQNLANNAGRKIEATIKDLSERWMIYAQQQLAPYLELQRLVAYLPEVAASEAEIQQIIAQIRAQIVKPPMSAVQLDQFDGRLADLGRHLESVARLPDEVRAFLMKVVEKRATLADLTPEEVQAWINEGGRAAAFSISFSQRRS